ncbi:type IV pilin protein [Mucisphaera calidilacus]|uniref:Type II secretion system protein G n=1 Tax=Mucisphaera calidilacus TaxID=2527982 RepID=A0A518BW00_9BACT|nr:type II secretion system GspH family protein [Mucisphaera calidilacus]QDU71156.1 hypothetical protein Pan265_10050 [Mucisphaera calidilacus]
MRSTHQGLAFSELLVAIVILALLSLIVVPQYGVASVDREADAAAEIVEEVQAAIIAHWQTHGRYPSEIEAAWFPQGKMMTPYRPKVNNALIEYGGLGEQDPFDVRLSGPAAYWYNPSNGNFRAFVPDQGKPLETQRLYHKINR